MVPPSPSTAQQRPLAKRWRAAMALLSVAVIGAFAAVYLDLVRSDAAEDGRRLRALELANYEAANRGTAGWRERRDRERDTLQRGSAIGGAAVAVGLGLALEPALTLSAQPGPAPAPDAGDGLPPLTRSPAKSPRPSPSPSNWPRIDLQNLPPAPAWDRPPPNQQVPLPSLTWDPVGYAGPAPDLAVVIGYHSPANYLRPRLNLLYILSLLERMDVPVTLVELAYPTQTHTFEGGPYRTANATGWLKVVKVRSRSYMFHKEDLWTVGVRETPPEYRKLVFLDGDVVFHEQNWPLRLSALLDDYDVVQPFRYALWRHPANLNLAPRQRPGLAFLSVVLKQAVILPRDAHPGYAIAARRDWLDKVRGWFQFAVEGGGDSFNCYGVMRLPLDNVAVRTRNKHIVKNYARWLKRIERHPPRIMAAPWDVSHLPHGNRKNRGYRTRHAAQRAESGDYSMYFNADGVLEFTDRSLSKSMLRYFRSRLEDA